MVSQVYRSQKKHAYNMKVNENLACTCLLPPGFPFHGDGGRPAVPPAPVAAGTAPMVEAAV